MSASSSNQSKTEHLLCLIFSHLNYCSLVWATTGKTNIMKILSLQKKMIRHIDNMGYLETTRPAFLKHKIIKIEYFYTFRLLNSFYFSNTAFKNFLVSTASLAPKFNSSNTRNSDTWYVPWFRNKYSLQSLKHNLPHILNKYKGTYTSSSKELRMHFVNMWSVIVYRSFCDNCTCYWFRNPYTCISIFWCYECFFY